MVTIKPTIRQKMVVGRLVANGSKGKGEPIAKTLMAVGYSGKTARAPSKVTGAVGFQKALEDAGVDDTLLSKVIEEGLRANRPLGNEGNTFADYGVRHKYLETSLRLKGLVQDKGDGDTYNTFVQQNNINPNTPDSKALVGNMVDYLMDQTKAK